MKNYKSLKILKRVSSACLIAHINPDADAICSLYAMKDFLTNKFNIKSVDIFAENDGALNENYKNLLGANTLNPTPKKYDASISLDCTTPERMGKYITVFNQSPIQICIDHHATNNFKLNLQYVEQTSSTCEILYAIFNEFNYAPPAKTMARIYCGLIADTNNFTVGNISQRTFNTAGACAKMIDVNYYYNLIFNNRSLSSMQILSLAIKNITTYKDGKIIISSISNQEIDNKKITANDFEGIINQLAQIAGNIFTCFIYPIKDSFYVSMRAKKGFDVGVIAKQFNGGGHIGASAFQTTKPIEEIKQDVLAEFNKQIK